MKSKFKSGDSVRHKNGGIYVILSTPVPHHRLEQANQPFYTYALKGEESPTVWYRAQSAMEDGRFSLVLT